MASLVADGDVGIAALVVGRAIDGDATAFERNGEALSDGLRLPMLANFLAFDRDGVHLLRTPCQFSCL